MLARDIGRIVWALLVSDGRRVEAGWKNEDGFVQVEE